ncbi:response regulator transcription factor [Capillimicrobium parvum]|uniref:Response regulator MprA n=1 Tax=Capillimicrobium parvum TaxID=2884022 RepID=A0A9E6XX39_9ACTN|nr:response regulator transcription factor [Capillimicrobium parvum]UGS35391.1 Response regulator MprA [Capillimicrobium parvum]
MSHRLLVVEDDADLRSVLRRGLSEEGFDVTAVADGAAALAASGDEPDALVIDIGLPDADGRDVCQALRARGTNAPVLFLTARDALTDRLSGFSAGGDDYLTKPFHFAELVARLRALLRRTGADASVAVREGLRLDPTAHAIRSGDAEVLLTPTEFRLLAALAARPGTVLRRAELVRSAWPDGAIVHDNTLDQYLARLRRKLRAAGADEAIATVHGVGYRMVAGPATLDPG